MKKMSFFKTKEGELCLAGLMTLGAFPVVLVGYRAGIAALNGIAVLMIVLGMLFSPLRAFVFKRREN